MARLQITKVSKKTPEGLLICDHEYAIVDDDTGEVHGWCDEYMMQLLTSKPRQINPLTNSGQMLVEITWG